SRASKGSAPSRTLARWRTSTPPRWRRCTTDIGAPWQTRHTTYRNGDVAPTGVDGLDDLLAGGLTRRRLYLIEGVPGSGKTTLAMQFLMEGAARGESVLYVTHVQRSGPAGAQHRARRRAARAGRPGRVDAWRAGALDPD